MALPLTALLIPTLFIPKTAKDKFEKKKVTLLSNNCCISVSKYSCTLISQYQIFSEFSQQVKQMLSVRWYCKMLLQEIQLCQASLQGPATRRHSTHIHTHSTHEHMHACADMKTDTSKSSRPQLMIFPEKGRNGMLIGSIIKHNCSQSNSKMH